MLSTKQKNTGKWNSQLANHRKIAVRLVCYNASSITENINGRGEINFKYSCYTNAKAQIAYSTVAHWSHHRYGEKRLRKAPEREPEPGRDQYSREQFH